MWPVDADPLASAIANFDPDNPAPLLHLIESNDAVLRQRGLFVFSEIGRISAVLMDAAMRHAADPDQTIRAYVMDGVMGCAQVLPVAHATTVLKRMDDPFCLVREKVITYLACAPFKTLDAAIAAFDEPLRSEHRAGLDVLRAAHADAQALFHTALAHDGLRRAYTLAAVERMARSHLVAKELIYDGDDEVVSSVVWQVKRFVHRRNTWRLP